MNVDAECLLRYSAKGHPCHGFKARTRDEYYSVIVSSPALARGDPYVIVGVPIFSFGC